MNATTALTADEVRRALELGLFTITSETPGGYWVTCFRTAAAGGPPVRVSQSTWCVRPRTARRYAERLVRAALAAS